MHHLMSRQLRALILNSKAISGTATVTPRILSSCLTRAVVSLVVLAAVANLIHAQSAPTQSGSGVSLNPTSVTFKTAQVLLTTSPAQSITLTNSGSSALTITSIAASGDFAATNNCGATLAAKAKCTISVTFTPTAVGVAPQLFV